MRQQPRDSGSGLVERTGSQSGISADNMHADLIVQLHKPHQKKIIIIIINVGAMLLHNLMVVNRGVRLTQENTAFL